VQVRTNRGWKAYGKTTLVLINPLKISFLLSFCYTQDFLIFHIVKFCDGLISLCGLTRYAQGACSSSRPTGDRMRRDDASQSWSQLAEGRAYGSVLGHHHWSTDAAVGDQAYVLEHGEHHWQTLQTLLGQDGLTLPTGIALDFGCGVGRLVLPMARTFQRVIGVDIAPGMRAETLRNAQQAGLRNVEVAETLAGLPSVDFVHSYVVLHHLARKDALTVVGQLLDLLKPGGIAALWFLYEDTRPWWWRFQHGARRWIVLNGLANLLHRRPWREPFVRQTPLKVSQVLARVQTQGVSRVHLHLAQQQPAYRDAYLVVQRTEERSWLEQMLRMWEQGGASLIAQGQIAAWWQRTGKAGR
jgi:SAM-dependent methyltransferase